MWQPVQRIVVLSAIGMAVAGGTAAGQIEVEPAEQPEFVAVAGPDAVLRCGPTASHYVIAELEPGQVLAAYGEAGEYRLVGYPPGLSAFVNGSVVELDATGTTARLTRPSRLKAANLHYGLRGSWKSALERPLLAGTPLRVLESIEATDGETYYRVEAPSTARAFVLADSLRPATREEVTAFLALRRAPAGQLPQPSDAVPADQTPPNRPNEPPPTQPATAGQPAAGTPAAGLPPTLDPRPRPTQPQATEPSQSQPAQPSQPSPRARLAAQIRELESVYVQVMAQPILEAECEEAMAEFRRLLEQIEPTPETAPLRARLQQRLDLLALRVELRRELVALAEARQSVDQRVAELARHVAQLDRSRQYTIVGRLAPSTVYDGKRLPLMYRVQSVGDAVPRTLGYLRPDETDDELGSMLGQIVGVVGRAELDRSLSLRIVQPERVDLLAPADAVAAVETGDGG